MKKFLLGGVVAILINYCIGATYLLYKVGERNG